ncbi:hypothetical protein [Streptomyces agglomeratus]|uniref:hypothetical protein n=1 Tax=Streptomyces agglomeratus TaxID=285458 RepID=UPI001F0AA8ED|nr:hypothetical protein [Streptomyces agglomeratus]
MSHDFHTRPHIDDILDDDAGQPREELDEYLITSHTQSKIEVTVSHASPKC